MLVAYGCLAKTFIFSGYVDGCGWYMGKPGMLVTLVGRAHWCEP